MAIMWKSLTATLLIAGVFIWMLLAAMTMQAHDVMTLQPVTQSIAKYQEQPTPTATPVIGEPCGHTEKVVGWMLCLHGQVLKSNTPIAEAEVKFSLGATRTVTDVTSALYQKDGQPAYGINIAVITPTYLSPITVTASHNGESVTRRLLVIPDFYSQTQRYNLNLSSVLPTGTTLWGYVYDYTKGWPVDNIAVIVERNGKTASVTSQINTSFDPYPFFSFSDAQFRDLRITPASTLTLILDNNGLRQRSVVTYTGAGQQVNLLSGWPCNGEGILPNEGGKAGVPNEGGRSGIPNEGGRAGIPREVCFWGYGTVDGRFVVGMDVYVTIKDKTYTGKTHIFPGEDRPRYGITAPGIEMSSDETIVVPATVTGVYSGLKDVQVITISVGISNSAKADLAVSSAQALDDIASGNTVYDLAWYDRYLWAATNAGVMRWDPTNGQRILLNDQDGIPSIRPVAIAADQQQGRLVVGFDDGAAVYTPTTATWAPILIPPFMWDVAVAPDHSLWLASDHGLYHYSSDLRPLDVFTTSHGLPHEQVQAVAVDPDGVVWFGTKNGAGYYNPYTNTQWVTFTIASSGLVTDNVRAIAFGPTGTVWFGTWGGGVSRYDPNCQTEVSLDGAILCTKWETFTTQNSGLAHNQVHALAIDPAGRVWIGTNGGGVSRYTISSREWFTYTRISPLSSLNVHSALVAPEGSVWFGTRGGGISEISPTVSITDVRFGFVITDSMMGDDISAITTDIPDEVWFGNRGQAALIRYSQQLTPNWRPIFISELTGDNEEHTVTDLAVDTRKRIWASVWQRGLAVSSPITSTTGITLWTRWNLTNTSAPLTFTNAIAISNSNVWIGTTRGLVHTDLDVSFWETTTSNSTGGRLPSNWIEDVAIDHNNVLWLATNAGVVRYAPPEGWTTFSVESTNGDLVSNAINVVNTEAKDAVWVGTDQGACRYKAEWWTCYTATNSPLIGSRAIIYDIAVDRNGDVWVATQVGVWRYNPSQDRWERFPKALTKVPNSSTPGIGYTTDALAIDQENTIWFGTFVGAGLWEIPPRGTDLAVDIDGPAYALPGVTPAVYTITVANISDQDALTTTLKLDVPGCTPSVCIQDLKTLKAGSPPIVKPITVTLIGKPGSITATITVSTVSSETILNNNTERWVAELLEPRADVRTTLVGPPLLERTKTASFTVWVDNVGGLAANNVSLRVRSLPEGLSWPSEPIFESWNIPPAQEKVFSATFTVNVAENVQPNILREVVVETVFSGDEPDKSNNQAAAAVWTDDEKVQTLILIAGEQMARRTKHGASKVISATYQLAKDPRVNGMVVDVLQNSAVREAYALWNRDRENQENAILVAVAIKSVISDFTVRYPSTRYIIFVGSDDIIPFYRVRDLSKTEWPEEKYGKRQKAVPPGTVRAALEQNYFLTDDYYTDREAQAINLPLSPVTRTLYLPDFISGRLVETPKEIVNQIDAFLQSDGQVHLGRALVGSDLEVTYDTARQQCKILEDAGIQLGDCTNKSRDFKEKALKEKWGTIWNWDHSNHMGMGNLEIEDLKKSDIDYSGTLLLSIGCHSGLNVPDGSGSRRYETDLMQVFLGKGGVAIAPTAYAYGAKLELPSFSEEFLLDLSKQLIISNTYPVGAAFLRAKHRYFAKHQQDLDPVDEKSLVALTFYGLPMRTITTDNITPAQEVGPEPVVAANLAAATAVSYTTVLLTDTSKFVSHTVTNDNEVVGQYWDYAGAVRLEERLPIQPVYYARVPPTLNGQNQPRGLLLRGATYEDQQNYNPVIAQAWIIGEDEDTLPYFEPPSLLNRWDYTLPHSLGYFPGLTAIATDSLPVASVNLVLGACKANEQDNNICDPERRFTSLKVDVLYSASDDHTVPSFGKAEAIYFTNTQRMKIDVSGALDAQSEVVSVVAVCDVKEPHQYVVVNLTPSEEQWTGSCWGKSERYYIQVVDGAGNVFNSQWFNERTITTETVMIHLPIVMYSPLPDLVVASILATEDDVQVVISNKGKGPVTNDFWVDVYLNPITKPTTVNQEWPELGSFGLVWGVRASTAKPIQPGASVTLSVGSLYYTSTYSLFPEKLAVGTPVHAQVDSANRNTTTGGVQEEHEDNNILGPVLSVAGSGVVIPIAQDETQSAVTSATMHLPERTSIVSAPTITPQPIQSTDQTTTTVLTDTITESNSSLIWLPIIVR